MKILYKGSAGERINLVLQLNGAPISLTNATVKVSFVSFGTNHELWNASATVDSAPAGLAHYTLTATDTGTVGDYYCLAVVTYTPAGNVITQVLDNYKIIQNQQAVVTYQELQQFMDIPPENFKQQVTVDLYVQQAQADFDLSVPQLVATQDQKFIELKHNAIRMKAALFYFLNMSENDINPDIRIQKIQLWSKMYNETINNLNNVLSSDPTATAVVRRVSNTGTYPQNPLSQYYDPTSS